MKHKAYNVTRITHKPEIKDGKYSGNLNGNVVTFFVGGLEYRATVATTGTLTPCIVTVADGEFLVELKA